MPSPFASMYGVQVQLQQWAIKLSMVTVAPNTLNPAPERRTRIATSVRLLSHTVQPLARWVMLHQVRCQAEQLLCALPQVALVRSAQVNKGAMPQRLQLGHSPQEPQCTGCEAHHKPAAQTSAEPCPRAATAYPSRAPLPCPLVPGQVPAIVQCVGMVAVPYASLPRSIGTRCSYDRSIGT